MPYKFVCSIKIFLHSLFSYIWFLHSFLLHLFLHQLYIFSSLVAQHFYAFSMSSLCLYSCIFGFFITYIFFIRFSHIYSFVNCSLHIFFTRCPTFILSSCLHYLSHSFRTHTWKSSMMVLVINILLSLPYL